MEESQNKMRGLFLS